MVIGVEPLGHLERRRSTRDAGGALGLGTAGAARHGKMGSKRGRPLARPAVTLRDRTEGAGGLQHMVIEGKVARGDMVDAAPLLKRAAAGAECGGSREQFNLGAAPGPV